MFGLVKFIRFENLKYLFYFNKLLKIQKVSFKFLIVNPNPKKVQMVFQLQKIKVKNYL